MEKELQGKLVEILTGIQNATGKAADFALDQLPDIAQSYVAYGRSWSVASAVLALIGLWACVHYARKWFKISDGVSIVVPGAFLGIPLLVFFVEQMNQAMLVWFAPKVWLLKELAKLVK